MTLPPADKRQCAPWPLTRLGHIDLSGEGYHEGTMSLLSALSRTESWQSDLVALDDQPLIGQALAACARLMLPYWESHYPRDDLMKAVVSAMSEWAITPNMELRTPILDSLRGVAVESQGYLSPAWPVPQGSNCPADFAGDSIVAAANAIIEIGGLDFRSRASDGLESATQAISQMMGHRQPDDEATDFWSLANEHLRNGIIADLESREGK